MQGKLLETIVKFLQLFGNPDTCTDKVPLLHLIVKVLREHPHKVRPNKLVLFHIHLVFRREFQAAHHSLLFPHNQTPTHMQGRSAKRTFLSSTLLD